MLQCPHCDHRIFETDMHLAIRVLLTGLPNGDYREEEIDSYYRTWDALRCCRCGQHTDEDIAQACFDAATGADWIDADIDDWYVARSDGALATIDPELESYWSLACAWNLWLWKEEHGFLPETKSLEKHGTVS